MKDLFFSCQSSVHWIKIVYTPDFSKKSPLLYKYCKIFTSHSRQRILQFAMIELSGNRILQLLQISRKCFNLVESLNAKILLWSDVWLFKCFTKLITLFHAISFQAFPKIIYQQKWKRVAFVDIYSCHTSLEAHPHQLFPIIGGM